MRPRVFPAEDQFGEPLEYDVNIRFNEAAGIPRGRHPVTGLGAFPSRASMRPRVFPAEDVRNVEAGRGQPDMLQ